MLTVPETDRQPKVPVVHRPGAYTITLERATPEYTFAHCIVTGQWAKELKRQLLKDFEVLKELHHDPLYTIQDPANVKHRKFIMLFGFRYIHTYVDATNGKTMHIYSTRPQLS